MPLLNVDVGEISNLVSRLQAEPEDEGFDAQLALSEALSFLRGLLTLISVVNRTLEEYDALNAKYTDL